MRSLWERAPDRGVWVMLTLDAIFIVVLLAGSFRLASYAVGEEGAWPAAVICSGFFSIPLSFVLLARVIDFVRQTFRERQAYPGLVEAHRLATAALTEAQLTRDAAREELAPAWRGLLAAPCSSPAGFATIRCEPKQDEVDADETGPSPSQINRRKLAIRSTILVASGIAGFTHSRAPNSAPCRVSQPQSYTRQSFD